MPRHGADQHYLRPDGVYITSELQPTLSFDPVRDTQAVGAMFVAPVGLAGPAATIHLLGRTGWRRRRPLRGLGATPIDSLRGRWQAWVAKVKVNLATNKFLHDMRMLPAPAVQTLDVSPRPANSNPTALAVQSGWAPSPQTPASQSGYMPAQGDPPDLSAVNTGLTMDPAGTGFPVNFWQQTIQEGYSPVVAFRAEDDALKRFYGNMLPTTGSRG